MFALCCVFGSIFIAVCSRCMYNYVDVETEILKIEVGREFESHHKKTNEKKDMFRDAVFVMHETLFGSFLKS